MVYGLGKTAPGRGLPSPRECYFFTVAVVEEGVDNFSPSIYHSFCKFRQCFISVVQCFNVSLPLTFFATRIKESPLFYCFNFVDMGFVVFEQGRSPNLVCFSCLICCCFALFCPTLILRLSGDVLFFGEKYWLLAFIIAEFWVL